MDRQLTDYYKLNLSHDLVMFLMNVMFGHLSQDQKVIKVQQIMEAWQKRVENKITKLTEDTLPQVAREEGFEPDVARILIGIMQYEPSLIRQEYVSEVKSVLYSSFSETKT